MSNALVDLYNEKYGGTKTAGKMPPAVKAKFEANAGNPGAAPGGKKPARGTEKKADEKLAEFQGGKIANAAFFNELGQLNARDVASMNQAFLREDSLVQKIRSLP